MSNLVIQGRDNSVIQHTLEKFKEEMERSQERMKFLTKQIEQLKEQWETKKKGLWHEIEEEIDKQGYIKDGKKAGDLCLEIDWDTFSIKKGDPNRNHPLAGLLGGILRI
jgi:hypothetical protein